LEDVYFEKEEVSESREEQMKRIYELSQVNEIPDIIRRESLSD